MVQNEATAALPEHRDSHESVKPRNISEDSTSTYGHEISRHITTKEDEVVARILSGNESWSGPIPSMGWSRPYPPMLPDREAYRVEFDEGETANPHNWSLKKQIAQASISAFVTMIATFGSASFSPSTTGFCEHFGVGREVGALAVSLYVMGFATGPIIWGPLSEQLGRKIPITLGLFMFVCFLFAVAAAKDVQTVMLGRFFAGVSGASPLAIVPAVMGDIFPVSRRGAAIAVFALAVFGGPMLGPVIGGYIANSYLGWRWTSYITGIAASAGGIVYIFFAEESYHGALLAKKAREIRKRTGNWGIYAEHDTVELDVKQMVTVSCVRPMKMLVVEPILLLLSLYSGYIYGLLYALLSAVPIIFEGYGWKGGNIMLPYLALFLGCAAATLATCFYFEPKFKRDLAKSGLPVCPEARLPPMMSGSVAFTIGIFWMCWTGAYPKTAEHPNGCHWILPCIGGVFLGYGLVAIFMPIVAYLIDAYILLAASAMSAKTFLRSIMGAVFPLFAAQMFRNLGIQWAGLLIGCLSLIMAPVPYIFGAFGSKIRSKSKYAINLEDWSEEELKNFKPGGH